MNQNLTKKIKKALVIGICSASLILTSCQGDQVERLNSPIVTRTLRSGPLTPYFISSPTPELTPSAEVTATLLPSLTPTPRTHQVIKGEDMFGIALRYGVTLEELMAANPEIKPNAMSIGTVLIIPGFAQTEEENTIPGILPSPTAVPVTTGSLFCVKIQDGDAWCSLPVYNIQSFGLEGLSAEFKLTDPETLKSVTQLAFPPIDILPPGKSLPLTAYFSGLIPDSFQASAEIKSSLPNPSDGRYLAAILENQNVFLGEGNLSAQITAEIKIDQPGATARRIWIAAIAYDNAGNVIGVRRWEMPDELMLSSGETLPAQLHIYSSSGAIEKIELFIEARP